jgi:hypothetical protein
MLINFLVGALVVGCTASASNQPYENSEAGIKLEKPSSWDLAYSKRNGVIYLATEKGFGQRIPN